MISEQNLKEMAVTDNAPKDLLIWSGGLDSTAIMLDHIRRGVKLDTAYITAENNLYKAAPEKGTRQLIRALIEAKYYPGWFSDVEDRDLHYGLVKNRGDVAFSWQPAMWLTAIVHGYWKHWDYRNLLFGYVHGDSIWHTRREFLEFFDALKALHARDVPHGFAWPTITFPLEWLTKAQVIRQYYLVDEMGREVLRHIWTCEHSKTGPTGAEEQCGVCEGCRALYLAKVAVEETQKDGVAAIEDYGKLQERFPGDDGSDGTDHC